VSGDFNWWLVLVGVVAGAALTWLVVAESQRREREIGDRELEAEAGWIARTADVPGLDADRVEHILRAHRRYLRFPPPDTLVDPATLRELDGVRPADAPDALPAPAPARMPAAGPAAPPEPPTTSPS
jgi:hypothetical protein